MHALLTVVLMAHFSSLVAHAQEKNQNAFNERLAETWKAACAKLPAVSKVSVVRKDGKTETFPSLPDAFVKAKIGDTYLLERGVYNGAEFFFPRRVTIRGVGDETVLGSCASEQVYVRGDDVVIENVLFSKPMFAPNPPARMWLVDVGTGSGILDSNMFSIYQMTNIVPTNVIRIFGHSMAYSPGDTKRHMNFYVGYERYDDDKWNVAFSSDLPLVPAMKGYENDVISDYKHAMPVVPRGRAKRFIEWFLENPDVYAQATPFHREVLSKVFEYFRKKYPDIEVKYDVAAVDSAIGKAKAALEAKRPLLARYLLEKADALSSGQRAEEITALRALSMEKGLAQFACQFSHDYSDNGSGAATRFANSDLKDSYANELKARLTERYPIMKLGARAGDAATCKITMSTRQDWRSKRSSVTESFTTTLVETAESSARRLREKEIADAAWRAAERQAAQANQGRWDSMIKSAQDNWKSVYDNRTRIESQGGDTYVISYREKDSGAMAKSMAAANANADGDRAAANVAKNAARTGSSQAQYEEKKTFHAAFSRNFTYLLKVDVKITDGAKVALQASNPTINTAWGVSGCKADKVGTPFESVNLECNNMNAGGTDRIDRPYHEQYVFAPITAFLGLRWTKHLATILNAADKSKTPDDKLEGYLTAALLGAPVSEEEMVSLTETVLGEKRAMKDLIAVVLKE